MGWDIEFYDNDVKIDHVNGVTNLTYNYSWWIECHEYWQPRRDYDGKTVGEAIAIMEQAVSKLIKSGINVIDMSGW